MLQCPLQLTKSRQVETRGTQQSWAVPTVMDGEDKGTKAQGNVQGENGAEKERESEKEGATGALPAEGARAVKKEGCVEKEESGLEEPGN